MGDMRIRGIDQKIELLTKLAFPGLTIVVRMASFQLDYSRHLSQASLGNTCQIDQVHRIITHHIYSELLILIDTYRHFADIWLTHDMISHHTL